MTDRMSPPPIVPARGYWQGLIGRRIEGVIISGHGGGEARTQVYLVLDGEEHFEICATGYLTGSSKLYPGGVFEIMASHGPGHRQCTRVFGPVEAPEETPEE